MNFFDSYSSFDSNLSFVLGSNSKGHQSNSSNPFQTNLDCNFISSMLSSNQKRTFVPSMDLLDFNESKPIKKHKPNKDMQISVKSKLLQREDPEKDILQTKNQFQAKDIEVINIDDDDDDEECFSKDNLSEYGNRSPKIKMSNNYLQNKTDNRTRKLSDNLETVRQKVSLWSRLSLSDLLLVQLWNQTQLLIPLQKYADINKKSKLLDPSKNDDVFSESEEVQPSFNINERQSFYFSESVKENEIILIEDDEDTCQTTPQSSSQDQQNPQQLQSKNSSPLHDLEILDLKNCNFLDQTSQCQPEKNILIDVSSQAPEVSHSYNKATSKTVSRAVIPKLELNSVELKKKRVTRPIKQVWNPESYDFEVWIEKVEKALGMKITNQEKVIKTLESYEGNIEIALSKIRRNKAYYKNYFKVQRIERVQNPYA